MSSMCKEYFCTLNAIVYVRYLTDLFGPQRVCVVE